MLDYFHSGLQMPAHELNAKRLRACASEALKAGVGLQSLQNSAARGHSVLVMSDWLVKDGRLNQILDASKIDVDLFVTTHAVPWGAAQQVCQEFPVDLGIALDRVLGIHISARSLSQLMELRTNDVRIRLHPILSPVICDGSFHLSKHVLGTKGSTLMFFQGMLRGASVDAGELVARSEWGTRRRQCLDRLLSARHAKLIVRSSAVAEDSFASSMAGAYTSVSEVDGLNPDVIEKAVQDVFESYGNGSQNDQVLVQRQITDSVISGVCTSRVIGRNSPYFVINYDDTSGRTDTVTAGSTNQIKTLYVLRSADLDMLRDRLPESLFRLISTMREIEDVADCRALDVEFIVDSGGALHIVQVRPLVGEYGAQDDAAIAKRVKSSADLLRMRIRENDGVLLGRRSAFGVMPDANPAELIGIKPRPLAFSLYQRLITDDVVTCQRMEYGYRDVRPVQHMARLGGSPFIDVRSSFNSFTPADLNPDLVSRLVDLYIERLQQHPDLHDKVEFEIVVSTWFPGLQDWLRGRYGHALSESDITQIDSAAQRIFWSAMERVEGDHQEVHAYADLFDAVMCTDQAPLQKSWRLLEICHHHGCKPFAHLARSAFVAVSVLKGLVACGVMSSDEYEAYLHSIDSVSSAMERDAVDVREGFSEKSSFYSRYGHLRPGTYDILSPAYFEDPDRYLGPAVSSARRVDKSGWSLPATTMGRIEAVFESAGMQLSFDRFDRFARRAIHGRENGKFVYTRYLSHALDQLIIWGEECGLSRDDLSYLTVRDLDEFVAGTETASACRLQYVIERRQLEHDLDGRIELPDLLFDPADLEVFSKQAGRPNFITTKSTQGSSLAVKAGSDPGGLALAGRIVLIESADPGFDWLFGHSIGGLITRYGGANSHMAIRCAELGIPAAIGVGDVLFEKLMNSPALILDCATKRLTPSQA